MKEKIDKGTDIKIEIITGDRLVHVAQLLRIDINNILCVTGTEIKKPL